MKTINGEKFWKKMVKRSISWWSILSWSRPRQVQRFFLRFRNSGSPKFLSTPQRNYLACLDVVLSHVLFLDQRSFTLSAAVRRATGARLFPTLDCSLSFQCTALTTAGSKRFHFHVQKSREIQGSLRRLSEMPLLPFFLALAHAILMESKETASIRKMKISTSRQDI